MTRSCRRLVAFPLANGQTILGSDGSASYGSTVTVPDMLWAGGTSFLAAGGGATFAGTVTVPDMLWAGGTSFLTAGGGATFAGTVTVPDMLWAGGTSFLTAGGGATFAGTVTVPDMLWAGGTSFLAAGGGATFAGTVTVPDMFFAGGSSFLTAAGGAHFADSISVSTLTIRGGADVAEPFDIGSEVGEAVPGMVVVIDPQENGRLQVSSEAYDARVAGVVSGAGGLDPGVVLTQQDSDGTPVALSGRVHVWVDADANGAVRSGDLLTTSNTAGHAMRASHPRKSRGAILGKAMTSLESGRGLVLALVALQ